MPGEKIKILIIDDESEVRRILKDNLQRTGNYKVITAKEGNIGTWLASCRWHKPDLILLDIMMPGIDGFEVLRRLKKDKDTQLIPVIMVTVREDIASKIKAEGLYCEDYIIKPVELNVLKERIAAVLAKHGIAPGLIG